MNEVNMERAPAPTGRQFEIRGGGYRAVATEVGAGLRLLEHTAGGEVRPLISGYAEDEPVAHGAGQVLLPWANRVAGGRYTFDGQERQLDVSEPATGNAIHGLTRWMPWRVAEHTEDAVRLELSLFPHPGYPHTLELSVGYRVGTDGLAVDICARNTGVHPAPYGFGAHPYITPGVQPAEGRADEWTLHLPAERYLAVDERMIPSGGFDVDSSPYDFRKPRVLAGTALDTAFGGLQRELDGIGRIRLSAPSGNAVTLWLGRGLEWVQVFTGDALAGAARRAAVAIEPMSAPPDAFNSGTDLKRLEPGDAVTHRWGIQVG
ncbi:aldose 1-epimerase family protein [Actinospica sp. MGRD01-02]|uniref:Aldose 1-epimerase family protein n=1 Tax=Actinospica acidithermotolerans TaxID=2828514 RepID=A0A941EJ86_9ACTN|nr:aldose 1-epimerase family protein [Actinospica acidithermotolerans]MBR7830094.1 aldose 1-epimerase family protein [Actinospica acidithermotolerans]